ncbi:MAG TPA: DUF2279 domain-containing protein [Burkholderiales bacterium]
MGFATRLRRPLLIATLLTVATPVSASEWFATTPPPAMSTSDTMDYSANESSWPITSPLQQEPLYRLHPFDPDLTRANRLQAKLFLGTSVGLVLLYGASQWWEDGLNTTFRSKNEGWFGQHTVEGGADKLGHFYSAYAGTRAVTRVMEWMGDDHDTALAVGTVAAAGTLSLIEVIDGFSEKYRFSHEDLLMGLGGAALGWLAETHPAIDEKFDFRFYYWPSDYARDNSKIDPVGDYSGQKYFLVTKASGFDATRSHPLLRYLELVVGYGARNYENAARDEPTRSLYYGVSLNLTEVLRHTAFKNDKSHSNTAQWTGMALELWQPPGSVVFGRHNLSR